MSCCCRSILHCCCCRLNKVLMLPIESSTVAADRLNYHSRRRSINCCCCRSIINCCYCRSILPLPIDSTVAADRFFRCRCSYRSIQLSPPPMDIVTLIQNEDFYAISQQVAVASNVIMSDNEVDEDDDIGDEEEDDGVDITQEHEVSSTFTTMKEKNTTSDSNWIVSQSFNKNDITRAGKRIFQG